MEGVYSTKRGDLMNHTSLLPGIIYPLLCDNPSIGIYQNICSDPVFFWDIVVVPQSPALISLRTLSFVNILGYRDNMETDNFSPNIYKL